MREKQQIEQVLKEEQRKIDMLKNQRINEEIQIKLKLEQEQMR